MAGTIKPPLDTTRRGLCYAPIPISPIPSPENAGDFLRFLIGEATGALFGETGEECFFLAMLRFLKKEKAFEKKEAGLKVVFFAI